VRPKGFKLLKHGDYLLILKWLLYCFETPRYTALRLTLNGEALMNTIKNN